MVRGVWGERAKPSPPKGGHQAMLVYEGGASPRSIQVAPGGRPADYKGQLKGLKAPKGP